MQTKLQIDPNELSKNNGAFSVPALDICGIDIDNIYLNDIRLRPGDYNINGNRVTISPSDKKIESASADIFIDDSRIRRDVNHSSTGYKVAITLAVIGLVGTIFKSTIDPTFFRNLFPDNLFKNIVMVEPDYYGADPTISYFQATIQWNKPSEKSYAFEESILDTHSAWYFIRHRENMNDPREAMIQEVEGPIKLKNGFQFKKIIPPEMKEAFCKGTGSLQMIVMALPRGQTVHNGDKISAYPQAKLLLTSSFRLPRRMLTIMPQNRQLSSACNRDIKTFRFRSLFSG